MDIANLLREEGKEEKGHLEHTLHLIGDLNDLHLQLMKPADRGALPSDFRCSNPNCRVCGPCWGAK